MSKESFSKFLKNSSLNSFGLLSIVSLILVSKDSGKLESIFSFLSNSSTLISLGEFAKSSVLVRLSKYIIFFMLLN